jgi:hypothetical protein
VLRLNQPNESMVELAAMRPTSSSNVAGIRSIRSYFASFWFALPVFKIILFTVLLATKAGAELQPVNANAGTADEAWLRYPQVGQAIVWRDTICNWIYRLSGIPDAKGWVSSRIMVARSWVAA